MDQQMSLPGGPIPDAASDQALEQFFSSTDYEAMFSGDDGTSAFNTDATVTPIDFLSTDMSQFNTDATVTPVDLSTVDMSQYNMFSFNTAVPEEVTPMQTTLQAPVPQPMAMPMPTAAAAHFNPSIGWFNPVENQIAGAHYNPSVGWYLPVANEASSFSAVPTPFADTSVPMQLPQQHSVPKLAAPKLQHKKTHANNFARQQMANKPKGYKRKQYFGPQAFFSGEQSNDAESSAYETDDNEQPSRKRANIDGKPRPTAQQEANNAPGVDKRVAAAMYAARFRGGKWPSITQLCVCTSGGVKIPRPKNAFILYRMQFARRAGGNNHQILSKKAAAQWHNESKAVKEHFHHLAEVEKQKHAEMYPGYKYCPKGNKQDGFGKSDCTCGAYEVNLAHFNENSDGVQDYSSGEDEDAEGEELDEYVPQRRQQKAPVAPMGQMMAPVGPAEMPNFNLPAAQQAQAAAMWEAMHAKKTAPAPVAVPVRRSTRNKIQPVSYVEPSDNVEDDIDAEMMDALTADDDKPASTPAPKHCPAPVNTSSTTVMQSIEPSFYHSPPAYNTRSKSLTPSTPGLDLPMLPEESDLDMAELFGDGGDFNNLVDIDGGDADADAEYDSDNITVAYHGPARLSSSASSGRTDPLRRTRASVSPGK